MMDENHSSYLVSPSQTLLLSLTLSLSTLECCSVRDKGTSSPLPVPCFFDVWHPGALTTDQGKWVRESKMAARGPSGVILVTSEDQVSKWLRNATETRSTVNTGKKTGAWSCSSCAMALSRKERPFSGHFTDDGMAGTTSAPAFETVREGHTISLQPWVVSVVISTPEYTNDIM